MKIDLHHSYFSESAFPSIALRIRVETPTVAAYVIFEKETRFGSYRKVLAQFVLYSKKRIHRYTSEVLLTVFVVQMARPYIYTIVKVPTLIVFVQMVYSYF